MKNLTFLLLAIFLLIFPESSFGQTDINVFLNKSREYERENKFNEAIAEIGKAIALEPNNANLYLRRANISQFYDNKQSIAEDVNKAISISAEDKEIVLSGARLLFQSQLYEKSLTLLNNLIYKDPANEEAFALRFHVRICLEDFAGAFEDVTKVIELNPRNSLYRTNQASLLSRLSDSEKAFELFARLIGSLESQLAKTDDMYEKISIKRDLARAYMSRAGVYERTGNLESSFSDLAKAIEYEPKEFNYRARALMYRRHKMLAEAIGDYTEAIRLGNEDLDVIYLLERGDTFSMAGKYAEALQDYEQALKIDKQITAIIQQRVNAVKARQQSKASVPK